MGEQHATHNAKEPAAHDSETSSSRAVKVPGNSFPHPLFQLREKLGNRSFGQLIQAKLTVSQPNDPYEQEADRVVAEVMRMAEPIPSRPAEEEEEEQEKGVQAKPLYPQITPLVQRQAEEDQEEEVQAKFLPLSQSMIQRQELGQDEEEEKKKLRRQPISQEEEEEESELQRQPIPQITPDVEARIRALKGSGRPLSESERKFFEPRFGVDFPEVRIHKNTAADELSHTLSANAFTTGKDIFFRQRAYDAESSQGKELLAHELTHVVQQGGAVQGKAAAIQPYDVSTGEAGRAVDKAEGRHSSKEMLSGKRPSVPEAPDGQRLFVYSLTRGSEPVNTSLVLNSSPTDVVIQTKPDTEVTGAIGLETWHKEINKWTFKAQGLLKESPLEAAYNFRVGLLLLQTSTPEQFRNQEEFNEFTDKCGEIALSESETLRAIGEFAQGFLILHSEAFPDTWADKLKNILPVCELDDVIKEVEYFSKEVEQIAESTPSYLFEHGLPVSYSEALMLEHFELAFLHAKLPFEHIVKEFVKAGIHWMIKEELFAFGNAWNVISRQLIEQVRKGKVAVNIELFNSIIKFSDDAKTWVKNLANVQDIDELNQLEEQANIFTDPIMSGIGMPSLLIGLGMGLRTWESVQASFAKRLLETDALIAEEGASSLPQLLQKIASLPMAPLAAIDILSMPRIQRIFRWAQEENYIPSLGEIIEGLLDNAGEILGYMALGFIPVVGEIIGVIFGVQLIVLILDFFDALTKAVSAKSTVELQRETARLVKISVDLAVTLGILAAFSSGKFVWRRAKKLMEENPRLSEEEAIKQAEAEKEATPQGEQKGGEGKGGERPIFGGETTDWMELYRYADQTGTQDPGSYWTNRYLDSVNDASRMTGVGKELLKYRLTIRVNSTKEYQLFEDAGSKIFGALEYRNKVPIPGEFIDVQPLKTGVTSP